MHHSNFCNIYIDLFFFVYYNKQPIETHGMCKVTGQKMRVQKQKKEDKNRNINKRKTKIDNFK